MVNLWCRYGVAVPIILAVLISSAWSEIGPGHATAPTRESGAPPVETILLAGQQQTWVDLPQPPYNAPVTVKMKLERVGYRVIFNHDEPFDAVLVMDYKETQGREYRTLEYGTDISCTFSLYQPSVDKDRPVWTSEIRASTPWPAPIASAYWDAVQNLEENPYYYYLAELLQGELNQGADAAFVLSQVIRKPLEKQDTSGSGFQRTGQAYAEHNAHRKAIEELGRLQDPRALPALWEVVEQGAPPSRTGAIRAIGQIGNPESLTRLKALLQSESSPPMQKVIEQAIQDISHHP